MVLLCRTSHKGSDLCAKKGEYMKIQIGILMLTTLLLNGVYADRTVWFVHPDSALNSIQAALDSCADNDIVLVGPGTYQEIIYWPNKHGIHLISELGPEVTIIDGNQLAIVIVLETGVDTTTIINGFTVRNGHSGIGCNFASSPTITNNIIRDNATWGHGAGINCLNNSAPIIAGNDVIDNSAVYGGGIYCLYSSPIICDNNIAANSACFGFGEDGHGGGIYCFQSSPIIMENYIIGNIGGWGAGICCWSSSPTICDNTIMHNVQDDEGDGGGITCKYGSQATITNCTIKNNDLDGIYSSHGSNPLIHNCNITDNVRYGIYNVVDTVTLDAEYNWWGDASGPYHPIENPGGLGDTVSDYVDFDPWLTNPGAKEYTTSTPLMLNLRVTPNPFSKQTTISFGTGQSPERTDLSIYDATGRLVKSFRFTPYATRQTLIWDGRDDQNRLLPSGTYFAILQVNEYTEARKLLLLR